VPFVITTGDLHAPDIGASALLHKPFNSGQLARALVSNQAKCQRRRVGAAMPLNLARFRTWKSRPSLWGMGHRGPACRY
jgi:hypothetical protein